MKKKSEIVKDDPEVKSLLKCFNQGKIGRRECLKQLMSFGLSAAVVLSLIGVTEEETEAQTKLSTMSTRGAKKVKRKNYERISLDVSKIKEKTSLNSLKMHGAPANVLDKIGQYGRGVNISWTKIYTEIHRNILSEKGQPIFESNTPLTSEEMQMIKRLGLR